MKNSKKALSVNVNYNLKNFRNYSLIKIGILNEEKSELYF